MKIDITKAASFVKAGAIEALAPQVKAAQEALEQGICAGNDFLGWMHLPSSITPEFIAELNATAKVLQENCEAVVVAGIGGSYLGARMVIDALSNTFGWLKPSKAPRILFAGNNIGEDYLSELFQSIRNNPKTEVEVDLPNQTVTNKSTGKREHFEINGYKKQCLLNGLDDIDFLVQNQNKTELWEQQNK